MNIERLKEIREDKDLLQKDIAKILRIPQQNYSRYELGIVAMPIEKYALLAKYYDTSIDYLVGLTHERRPYPRVVEKEKQIN